MARTLGAVAAALIIASPIACSAQQSSAGRSLDENALREYAGFYQWSSDSFVYLQPWAELTGKNQLVAFDESGDVRTLFPTDRDRFFAGPAAADSSVVQSRIEFQRDSSGKISGLVWRREGDSARVAERRDIEKHEDVNFVAGDVKLAGTLTSPRAGGKNPPIIPVHASGAQDRDYLL